MKKFSKLMAAVLALVMCLSLMPMAAFAADENPYQDEIKIVEGVKETANGNKTTLDGLGGATNPNGYPSIKNAADAAANKADEANTAADQVTEALKAAQDAVDKVVEEQQQKVDTEHAEDKGVIDGKTSEITAKTQEIVTAVNEANKQVEAVNNSLKELETADLTAEEKVAAAEKIQDAADQAKAAADSAKQVADDANAEMEAAVKAANQAKADYDAFVLAAQGVVDAAKQKEFAAKLSDAEAKLSDAEAKAKEAAAAKEAADKAKLAADKLLEAAQNALTEAKKTLNDVWPENGIDKDAVNQDAIDSKNNEANTAQGEADTATSEAERLGDEIKGHKEESTEKSNQVGAKTSERSTAELMAEGLRGDVNDLNAEKGRLTDAKTEYNTTVTEAEKIFNQAIETAKKQYEIEANRITSDLADANGVWGTNSVALEDSSSPNGYGEPLVYRGHEVKNNEFFYYLKVAELLDGTSQEYQALKAYYDQWKEETYNNGDPNKARFYDLLEKCEEAVTDNVTQQVIPAVDTRKTTITDAVNTLKDKTACETVTAVDGKITEVDESITAKNIEIGQLEQKIDGLNQEINTLTSRISELVNLINEKNDEKSRQEGIANAKNAEAQAAREAAQKLADLLALKEAMEAAQIALNYAKAAEEKALQKQTEAKDALDSYTDAQEAVKAAKEALAKGLEGELDAQELERLAKAVADAQTAALNAKKDYDDAKKAADDAQEAAKKAQDDAEDARQAAQDELDRINGGGGGTTTIDEPAVPLAAGPVTRAEFIDYLWRHEGEPDSDGVCTFTDVAEDHDYVLALAWAEQNGLVEAYEDGTFQPDELVTVADVRAILGNFADVFGTNAVAAADLTTLAGEDDEAVLNCDEVLAEFFGEEYVTAEDEAA